MATRASSPDSDASGMLELSYSSSEFDETAELSDKPGALQPFLYEPVYSGRNCSTAGSSSHTLDRNGYDDEGTQAPRVDNNDW